MENRNRIKHIIISSIRLVLYLCRQITEENFKCYLKPKNEHKTLVILANGPSLKEDLEKMIIDNNKNDYSVVNYFCNSTYFPKIKPSYYTWVDPALFYDLTTVKKYLDKILINNDNIKFFIPYIPYKKNKLFFKRYGEKIVPIHTNVYEGFESVENIIYRYGLGMPKSANVLLPCIFNGILLGYKRILLYGVDHTWLKNIVIDQNNIVCLKDTHFYDNQETGYRKWVKTDGSRLSLSENLCMMSMAFASYDRMQKFSEYMGCEIINMTKNSFIDAFKRG